MPNAAPVFDDVEPWPEAKDGAPAPRDHNRPPPEETVPLEFREALLSDRPEFLDKFEQYIHAANRAVATDDATLGRCGDLVKAYRACSSHIDAAHETVKRPYLTAGRLVDAEKNGLIERLAAAKRKVEAVANAFVADREAKAKAERDRLAAEQRAAAEAAAAAERAREQAEREAIAAQVNAANDAEREAANARADEAARVAEQAMKAAALAPAAPSKAEPVRSDEGATVSGKKEWKSEVTDFEIAFMAVSDDESVRDAITKAIARRVRAGLRAIEGVRIWPVAVASFR